MFKNFIKYQSSNEIPSISKISNIMADKIEIKWYLSILSSEINSWNILSSPNLSTVLVPVQFQRLNWVECVELNLRLAQLSVNTSTVHTWCKHNWLELKQVKQNSDTTLVTLDETLCKGCAKMSAEFLDLWTFNLDEIR